MKKYLTAVWLMVLLAACAVAGEEVVPRRLCAFAELQGAAAARGRVGEGGLKDLGGIKEGTNVLAGIAFAVGTEVVVLKKGERLEIGPDKLRYAGDGGIGSQDDHDRGPLVRHRIETVYVLHTVLGTAPGKTVGTWTLGYEDGTEWEEELRLGENIGNRALEAQWAEKAGDGFTMTKILNPLLDKNVKHLQVEMEGQATYVLVGVTCKLGREPPHSN